MEVDAVSFAWRCQACQPRSNRIHVPVVELHSLSILWPSHTWAFNLIGPIILPLVVTSGTLLYRMLYQNDQEVCRGPRHVRVDKEEFSLEIAIPPVTKARDLFLQIWKKMSPTLNLETARQSVLAITSSEEHAQPLGRRAPSQKGKGRVLTKSG